MLGVIQTGVWDVRYMLFWEGNAAGWGDKWHRSSGALSPPSGTSVEPREQGFHKFLVM